jgi:hypothetical protein
MICSCGNKDLINPEYGETMERYMARKICRNCNTRGNWKEANEEKKEIPSFITKHRMKNLNAKAGLDENDNYIHRRMQDVEYTKKEKTENKNDPKKERLNTGINYSKYAVGGESKEVPASALDENDNFIHRREQNTPRQRKGEKKE